MGSGWAIAGMVGAIVLTATAGDVLLASAMRAVGDLDEIKAEHGLRGAIWAVVSESRFLAGGRFHGSEFLLAALLPEPRGRKPHCSCSGFSHLCQQRRSSEMVAARKRGSPPLVGGHIRLLRSRTAQALAVRSTNNRRSLASNADRRLGKNSSIADHMRPGHISTLLGEKPRNHSCWIFRSRQPPQGNLAA